MKSLIRDASHLGSGTAAAQLIVVASAPVVTRLYDPATLGAFNAFISIATLLAAVSALAYPMAIVVARDHREATALSALSVVAIAFTSLTVTIAVWIAGEQFTTATDLEQLSKYLYFIPVLMALGGFQSIADFWAARTKQFRLKARSSVVAAASTAFLKICLGIAHPHPIVLIFSNIAGIITSVLLMFSGLKARYGMEFSKDALRWTDAKQAAARHSDFPLYRAPQIGINNLSSALPIVILASIFGTPAAAYFGLAMSTLGAPSKLIASSVGNAIYPRISELIDINARDAQRLVINSTLLLALIGLVPLIALILFAPQLFGLIFGEQWTRAGVYAQLLSPMLFLYFVNKPAVAAVPSLGLQKGLLVYEVLTTGTKIIVLFIGFYVFKDELLTVALFSATGTAAYLLLIAWVLRELAKFARKQRNDIKASR